jgi:hypothetical protein
MLSLRRVPWGSIRSVVMFAMPLWLIAIGTQVAIGSDIPVVAAFYGPVAASHYALGALLPGGAIASLYMILDVAFPRLSAYVRDDVIRLVRSMLLIGCVLASAGFGILVFNSSAILHLWVGASPPLAITVMTLYSVAWAFNVPTHVLALAAISRERHSLLAPVVIGEAAVNLGLSIALAKTGGPWGPAVATLIVLTASNLGLLPVLLTRRVGLNLGEFAWRVAAGYGGGLAASGAAWVLTAAIPVDPLRHLILATLLSVAGAGGVVLVIRYGSRRIYILLRHSGFAARRRQHEEGRAAVRRLAEERIRNPVIWVPSEPPLVTVRIATFNRPRLLTERAIASALAQTHQNIEVVVVGDHCEPSTEQAINRIRDPRIRFENLTEQGRYPSHPLYRWMVVGMAPMNRGLELARGQWIAPLDDDDEFTPDHVEVLLEECRERNLEFAYGIAAMEAEPGRWEQLGAWPLREGRIAHGSVLYWAGLRFIRYDLEGWRTGDGGDWNLWHRMRDAGVRMGFVEHVVCKHYAEGSALKQARRELRADPV